MTDAAAPPTTLNAKERRKLQREQERLKAEADAAAPPAAAAVVVAAAPIVKQENASKTDDAPLNAKERRKLARETERLEEEAAAAAKAKVAATKKTAAPVKKAVVKAEAASPDAAAIAPANGEKLNAQQRRLLARKASRPEDEATKSKASGEEGSKKRKRAGKATADDADPNKKIKSIHLTLFVGQLPYNATEAKVRQHFHEAGDIQVRMLTDKRTKKFKGTAFIEVKDSKALGAALSRHHTLLNGRRINVEMTASGGGNKSEQRRTKLELLRKKQSNVQVEKTKALIQKHIDSREYKLTKDDVDDRMIDFLSWFDYETAKLALEEYNRCVSDRVQNRKAFFMGILKRFRETDGVE
ncbi:H aca ribonucleoprotein complex subunit 1 [Globisporangium polare]